MRRRTLGINNRATARSLASPLTARLRSSTVRLRRQAMARMTRLLVLTREASTRPTRPRKATTRLRRPWALIPRSRVGMELKAAMVSLLSKAMVASRADTPAEQGTVNKATEVARRRRTPAGSCVEIVCAAFGRTKQRLLSYDCELDDCMH